MKKGNRAPMAYLAGPVRGLGPARAVEVRKNLADALVMIGIACFSPAGAWISNPDNERAEVTIKAMNDLIMLTSDEIVFVYIPEFTEQSAGSADELATCLRAQRNISLVCYPDHTSAALAWINKVLADLKVDWKEEGKPRMVVTVRDWNWEIRSTVGMPAEVKEVA